MKNYLNYLKNKLQYIYLVLKGEYVYVSILNTKKEDKEKKFDSV